MPATTPDAVELLHAELAIIGRTPSPASIQATMRVGFSPFKYLILADGKPIRFANGRLHARVVASSVGFLHPAAVIEVECRRTGERAVADMDGRFVHVEGVYHDPKALAWMYDN